MISPSHLAHGVLLVVLCGPEVGIYPELAQSDLKEALVFHGWGRDFLFLLLDMHQDSLGLTVTGNRLVTMRGTSLKMKSSLRIAEKRDGRKLSMKLLIILCPMTPLPLDSTLKWGFCYVWLKTSWLIPYS